MSTSTVSWLPPEMRNGATGSRIVRPKPRRVTGQQSALLTAQGLRVPTMAFGGEGGSGGGGSGGGGGGGSGGGFGLRAAALPPGPPLPQWRMAPLSPRGSAAPAAAAYGRPTAPLPEAWDPTKAEQLIDDYVRDTVDRDFLQAGTSGARCSFKPISRS
jgi:hypothetical protein